jgi:hypothetical protein
VAEYEGLVTTQHLAKGLGICRLLIRDDSQLVAKQVQKEYACNDKKMAEYLEKVCRMEKSFDGFKVHHVPRLDKKDVDHQACVTWSRAPTPLDMIIERLSKPSVKPKLQNTEPTYLMVIDGEKPDLADDWM